MNINSVPALITAITSALLGAFVYLRGSKLTPNRTWALLSFFVALWSFSVVMIMNAPNERMGLLWARMIYFGAIPIPATLLHFTLSYLQKTREKKLLIVLAYVLAGLFLSLNCTAFIIEGVVPHEAFKYFGVPGQTYFLFVLVWIGTVGWCFYEMIKAYRTARMIQKNQIKYLL